MSLDVSDELLAQAETGDVSPEDFIDTVRVSLPYAYTMVQNLALDLAAGDRPFADNQIPPATEADRGQLLRALASDSIRHALEEHFDVSLAFQNCHRVAVFPANAHATEPYRRFVSRRAQVLNQSPVLRDC